MSLAVTERAPSASLAVQAAVVNGADVTCFSAAAYVLLVTGAETFPPPAALPRFRAWTPAVLP